VNASSGRLRCVDGWYTDDADEFRFYMHDARQWSYRAQLVVDARSWKVWAWWVAAIAPATGGMIRGSLPLTIIGLIWAVAVLERYVHMLRTVVQGYRRSVLLDGVVAKFEHRHPLRRSFMAGQLRHEDQSVLERVTALLPEWAAKAHAGPDGSLRVLVAHSPRAEYSPVIGIRINSPPGPAADRLPDGPAS
jgi:hypothetical protein